MAQGVLRKSSSSTPKIVATNFQEQNFHATDEKSRHGVKGPPSRGLPLFLVGGSLGAGFFFFKLCLLLVVDCPLFIFHLDSEQSTFDASCFWVGTGGGVQSKRVPNSTSLLSHMLLANVVLLSTIYLGQRGRTLHSNI